MYDVKEGLSKFGLMKFWANPVGVLNSGLELTVEIISGLNNSRAVALW